MPREKPSAILAEACAAKSVLRGLYAITDPVLMPGERLFAKSEAALRGGCRVLQYRHKSADASLRQREALQLRRLCDRYAAQLFINDDPALALLVKADGVHVGQTDASVAKVREQVGAHMRVGISCHSSRELAQRAQQAGADYVAFGRFFPSVTKPQAPAADRDILPWAKQQLAIPRVAIGGITRDNARLLISQGADMVAVIHDLFAPDDLDEIEQRTRTYTQFFHPDTHE